jgi:adenine/guanine phosphoribosyltransferase-like PRPP-binding protein
MSEPWAGEWVARRFGVRLEDDGTAPVRLRDLVGTALRRNPRRAHLLVSTVLGKHVPVAPRTVHDCGLRLGELAGSRLPRPDAVLVLGYAETATALGHCVAERLGAHYLHSTRRSVAGVPQLAAFEESHSHATSHRLLPADPGTLQRPDPVVLVDDELSTGRTALNTIAALQALAPREHYIIASLVDVRGDAERARLAGAGRQLGTRIETVSLGSGRIDWPGSFPERARNSVATARPPAAVGLGSPGELAPVLRWPEGVKDGGRHGYTPGDAAGARAAAATVACALAGNLSGQQVLVLGSEELMYTPLLLAVALSSRADVRFSSTTRSPVLAIDEPGYPIRNELRFAAHDGPDDGPVERFAYNVAGHYSDIVLVVDDRGDSAELRAGGGLLDQLARLCARVHLVRVPSYRPVVAAP